MKRIVIFLSLLPLFCRAQEVPPSGFDKVRIADGKLIIQADLIPVTNSPEIKSDRFYFWYGSNIIHSTQGGFSGTLLNGSYNEYYLNKNLKEQGTFKNGLKDGIWKGWNSDGFLVEQYSWKKGLRSGKFMVCDPQGKITQKGEYKNDVLVLPDSSSFIQKINIFKKKE